MLEAISQRIAPFATWTNIGLLLALFILFSMVGFKWRQKVLEKHAGGKPVRTFDIRCWYTPEEARELLETMGKRGRNFYATTEVTLDYLFPLVYGSFFVLMLFKLYGRPGYLLLVPLITVIADLLENSTAAFMSWTYKGTVSPVVWAATRFTTVKRSAFITSSVLILVGVVIYLSQYASA
jgi:hypothetical protein